MRPKCNRCSLMLAAATTLILSSLSGASAEQSSVAVAKAGSMDCPEMAFEVAYQTPPSFISWLLERPELIAQIAAAEDRAASTMLKTATFMNGEINRRQTAQPLVLTGGGGE